MTNEQKNEVIKAFAYGLDAKIIAECNGLEVSEVLTVYSENSNEISNKHNEIKEVYGDVF